MVLAGSERCDRYAEPGYKDCSKVAGKHSAGELEVLSVSAEVAVGMLDAEGSAMEGGHIADSVVVDVAAMLQVLGH